MKNRIDDNEGGGIGMNFESDDNLIQANIFRGNGDVGIASTFDSESNYFIGNVKGTVFGNFFGGAGLPSSAALALF